jgi:ribosomal protein L29
MQLKEKQELLALETPQALERLAAARLELQTLRAKAAGNDLKNVRSIRKVRTTIARLTTRLKQLATAAAQAAK